VRRRAFVQGLATATVAASACRSLPAAAAGSDAKDCSTNRVIWKQIASPVPDVPVLDGHTDTVPDIVGRIGGTIGLAIFTEGNHFPALLGGEILDPFRAWARSDGRYAALDLANIVVVTLPQPKIVAIVLGGAITLGNLTLEVNRTSGFYPDIVMGGALPLRRLRRANVVAGTARVFAQNSIVRSQQRQQIALGLVGNHLDDVGQVLSLCGKLDERPLV
jgi:hypothetical protein